MHDLEPRIQRMYRRDLQTSVVLILALSAALLGLWFHLRGLLAPGPGRVLALAAAALVGMNGAAIAAMLRHMRDDRHFIYSLDIRHLDQYRLARRTGGVA